jgi:DNA mismatch repair protein MutL
MQLPPSAVDVNVHPSKGEVKFADSEMVYRSVVLSIRETLGKAPWLKEGKDPLKELRETPGIYQPREWVPSYPLKNQEFFELEGGPKNWQPVAQTPFLGQIDKTYLLFESSDGLTLIDQHAAHERILFERLTEDFSRGSIRKQSLLFADTIELSLAEAKVTEEHLLELERLGFEVEPSGARSFWIKSVPEILAAGEPIPTLKEMIGQISSWGKDADLHRSFDPLLRILACRGAIQASQTMNQEEATALLADLQTCSLPSHCPHGRPTLLKITLSDLEKMFGRK